MFAFSPFYPVLNVDEATLKNPELLKAVPLDGPPLTALAMSCDEEGILVCGTGRAMSSNPKKKKISAQPQLLRIDMSGCFLQNKEGTILDSTTFTVLKSTKMRDLATSVRICAGFSKATFCVRDQDVWCWRGRKPPHQMTQDGQTLSLALSNDGHWLATGHQDCTVCLWGPLDECVESMDGIAPWQPQKYKSIHTLPVQSVSFRRSDATGVTPPGAATQWILVSSGRDCEVHRMVAGEGETTSAYVAEKKLTEADVGAGACDGEIDVSAVQISSDRKMLCIAVESLVLVYSFYDLCMAGEWNLLASLTGHEDAVTCMCIRSKSIDQTMRADKLFSGSKDNTVRIWDVSGVADETPGNFKVTSQTIGPLRASITATVVDRKRGELLFVGLATGGIEIFRWMESVTESVQQLEFHEEAVRSLSTNASRRLVSGSVDNTIVIWEREGEEFKFNQALLSHDGNVNSVFMGFKGRKIASASTDTKILLWDFEDLQNPREFLGHEAAVTALCTNRDMQTIFSADQSGLIMEWDVISGTCRKTFEINSGREVDSSDGIASSPVVALFLVEKQDLLHAGKQSKNEDGQAVADAVSSCTWLVMATSDTVRIKQMDKQLYTERKGHKNHVSCVAMSEDSLSVVSASWDGRLILWDAKDKTQLRTFVGHTGPVFCCDINKDGKLIFSGSADTRIIVWDANNATPAYDLTGYHDDPVVSLKMVPADKDEVCFASGSQDHMVILWGMMQNGASKPQPLAALKNNIGVRCVIGPRTVGGFLGVGCDDGQLMLWKPEPNRAGDLNSLLQSKGSDDEVNGEIYELNYHRHAITSVYFSVDGHMLLASCSDGEISAWGVHKESSICMLKTFVHPGRPAVNCVRLSEQKDSSETLLVIAGCEDNRIYIWDYKSHIIEKVLTGHQSSVCDLEISDDSKVLISAARESRLMRWNLVRGTADVQLLGHYDGVMVTDVSKNGSMQVVTGGKDGEVMLWNTVGPSAGTYVVRLSLHTENVSCLALSKDGTRVLSGSWDTTVTLADLVTPQVIAVFMGHIGMVLGCAIGGEDESVFVSCCRGGRLIRWDAGTGSALWNISVGGPAVCLTFRQPNEESQNDEEEGMIVIGCAKENAIQCRNPGTSEEMVPPLLAHKEQVIGLQTTFNETLLCSVDRGGTVLFWDTSMRPYQRKGKAFQLPSHSGSVLSMAVDRGFLAATTSSGTVLLYDLNQQTGIVPGTPPRRVWNNHADSVLCVRFLVNPTSDQNIKLVTASDDGRALVHPIGEGTALWFSWRPVIRAAKSGNHMLFRYLLQDQPSIVREKVYPTGWTLLHALASLGDVKSTKELFALAGNEPLGFTFDKENNTPLDIALKGMRTELLDFLLQEASTWPQHVLEFNTACIVNLIPYSLPSMPRFLDSRLFQPLPHPGEELPTKTSSEMKFETSTSSEYFDPIGICGSETSSMSRRQYATNKLVISESRLVNLDDADEVRSNCSSSGRQSTRRRSSTHSAKPTMKPKDMIQAKVRLIANSRMWGGFIIMVVLVDIILTMLETFTTAGSSNQLQVAAIVMLVCFVIDLILRLAAEDIKFFTEKDKYMNTYEFCVVVLCVVVELNNSNLPVGAGRLLRPAMRIGRLLKAPLRYLVQVIKQAQDAGGRQSMIPIEVYCIYLHGVTDYKLGILGLLTQSKQPELFRSTTVKAIIEFKWNRYAQNLLIRNLTIFLFHTLIWGAYTVIAYNDYWAFDAEGNRIHHSKTHKDVLCVFVLLFTCHALYVEAWRFWIQGISYGKSFWNTISFTSNLTVFIVLVVELVDGHLGIMRSVAAVVSLLVWTHTLYFLRGFRGTGALVRMIVQIIADMRYFVIIMGIMSIAFTQLFYTLQTGIADPDKPQEVVWIVYNAAWLANIEDGFDGKIMDRLMFCVMTLFMIIVLLNLLIAIMSNTFAIVNEGAAVEYYFNLAELTNELEMLMGSNERRSHSRFPQYVIYSISESSTSGDANQKARHGTLQAHSSSLESTLDQIVDYKKSSDVHHNRVMKVLEDIKKTAHSKQQGDMLEDGANRRKRGNELKNSEKALLKSPGGLSRLFSVKPDRKTGTQDSLGKASVILEKVQEARNNGTQTREQAKSEMSNGETVWRRVQEERRLVHQEVTQMEWMWKQMREERIKMQNIQSGSLHDAIETDSFASI